MSKSAYLRVGGFAHSRKLLMPALILCAAAFLYACGGSPRNLTSLPTAPASVTVSESTNPQVAEVLAEPAPEGVDAALWNTLKNELARELGKRKISSLGDNLPMNEHARSFGFGWDDEFMRPDGNGDGIIGIADLSPIAVLYGQTIDNVITHYDPNKHADYNNDNIIDFRDITPLARWYGVSCSGFRVEFSGEGEDSGFSVAGVVDYSDYISGWPGFATFRRIYGYPCDTVHTEPLWIRIWVLDKEGADLGSRVFIVPGGRGVIPPRGCPLAEILSTSPPLITWSTRELGMPDGNQDGAVNWFDLGPISELFLADIEANPQDEVADYYFDGRVFVEDITPLAQFYGCGVGSFLIEVSTESADAGYMENGIVDYYASAGFNENGFRYYEYEIASPPVGVPYWVRVTPIAPGGALGTPSTVVEFGGAA